MSASEARNASSASASRPAATRALSVADARKQFSEVIDRSLKDPDCKGCLLVNSALDVAPHDAELGRVVADFTLPYACAELDEDEPEEPPLTRPPFRPPTLGDKAAEPGKGGITESFLAANGYLKS